MILWFSIPGIPDNPVLAETFYEQFNEFDDDNDIVVGGAGPTEDDGEGTLVGGTKDEDDFINYLERALDNDDEAGWNIFLFCNIL